MLVIKDKANIKIKYPLHKIADLDKTLFFDIETTGFSRKYCNVYLIGCMYFCQDTPMYIQWFAENFNDEANILMAFQKFLQKFNTLIHFNGNRFDIPFLEARGEKYHLNFHFERFQSIDIFKPLSKLNHILQLENQKQKTFEKYLKIERKDPFSGGDLIEVFKHYVESKDERLLFPLLLHNREDVLNMGYLSELLSIADLFEKKYQLKAFSIKDFKNIHGDMEEELFINATLDTAIPNAISFCSHDIYFHAEETSLTITIKVIMGTYKYFFHNYKDYYYLPLEDKAIHKSIASFVEPQYRKQATGATCYEKFSGCFLPVFHWDDYGFENVLKEDVKSKQGYLKTDALTSENIQDYCNMILDYLKERDSQ